MIHSVLMFTHTQILRRMVSFGEDLHFCVCLEAETKQEEFVSSVQSFSRGRGRVVEV